MTGASWGSAVCLKNQLRCTVPEERPPGSYRRAQTYTSARLYFISLSEIVKGPLGQGSVFKQAAMSVCNFCAAQRAGSRVRTSTSVPPTSSCGLHIAASGSGSLDCKNSVLEATGPCASGPRDGLKSGASEWLCLLRAQHHTVYIIFSQSLARPFFFLPRFILCM